MTSVSNKMKPEAKIHVDEDDKSLEEDLLLLVDDITKKDEREILSSLAQLKNLMQTSTTSMTSVPKPLKYLRGSYELLKNTYKRIKRKEVRALFADILSVLALAGATTGSRECLNFCLEGSMTDPGDWGHEYVRRLEVEITDEWANIPINVEGQIRDKLMPLITSIIKFDTKYNAEIQGCDLSLEIDHLDLLNEHLDSTNYLRVCNYLVCCAAYSEEIERRQILQSVADNYLKFGDYCKATLVAMQLQDFDLISKCFTTCPDPLMRKQLAFLVARQQDKPLRKEYEGEDEKDIEMILSNDHVNEYFQMFARELDILEPKLSEEIFKFWFEPSGIFRLNTEHDSARANLAASFASGFVHAGFGVDKLMSNTEESWVYKNKDNGMLSATASLGLIHMWDVDGGLVHIDKYLYTNEDFIKSGALLAIGLVNCGIRNECDPALALLNDYVLNENQTVRIGAVLGLGLAYSGSQRSDVSELMIGVLWDKQSSMEVISLAAISLGLINVGSAYSEASSAILRKLLELTPQQLSVTYSRFLPLALGMIYMGCRDGIEAPSATLEVLPEPYKLASQTMLQVCSYAGTGDVLIVQELLRICSEPVDNTTNFASSLQNVASSPQTPSFSSIFNIQGSSNNNNASKSKSPSDTKKEETPTTYIGLSQAIASLGVGVVGLADGKENSRIFGQVGTYGPTQARLAVPLALALSSLSNPDPALVDVLNKYSHDNDSEVSLNAIFGLGLVGAGTNNARLATLLRQLAAYHAKNPSHLFLVRISQGLIHLGKGTFSLCPLRFAYKVLDYTALAGLMVVFVAFLDCKNLILSKSHYLMYCLAIAMEPRWLVTLDQDLKTLPVSVRVGQAVDVIGKVGNPKSIAGGHVHTTPVLMSIGEKAELVTDQYEPLSSVLEGFVILQKKVE